MLRASDRGCGVCGDNLADEKPIVEHADGCQMLLHRGGSERFPQKLDVGSDVDGQDPIEREAPLGGPVEELMGVSVAAIPGTPKTPAK